MREINTNPWSINKDMIHPTRSDVNVTSFVEAGITCLSRALLECERIFFNNESE